MTLISPVPRIARVGTQQAIYNKNLCCNVLKTDDIINHKNKIGTKGFSQEGLK
jgi:hypothetical protein